MTTRYFILLFLLALNPPAPITAQYNLKENNIWAFGNFAGLDFTSGVPVAIRTGITSGTLPIREANASVCDANGMLSFYTNGETIWDRTQAVMPAANPLHPYLPNIYQSVTKSTTQGALIIPFPDSAGKYYVFSLTQSELGSNIPPGAGKLFYSVVDMDLNTGRGDVVPGRKWIPVDTNLAEKMIAIPGPDCNIWVLVHSRDSNLFKAYEITRAGLNPLPVLSYAGSFGNKEFWTRGEMKASPSGKKLAACASIGGVAELYDFNPATGIVSDALQLDSRREFYGAAFSPDDSKVYISYAPPGTNGFQYIIQYDLTIPTPAAILASRVQLGSSSFSQLRLGPDGKIYFQAVNTTGALGVIRNPDAAGTASQFVSSAVQLQFTTGMVIGLPVEVVKVRPPDTLTGIRMDTLFCAGVQSMLLEASPGYTGYRWDDGTPGNRLRITQPGIYRVLYRRDACHYGVDSFMMRIAEPVYSRSDTGFCAGEAILELHAPAGSAFYEWDDLTSAPVRTIDRTGTYWVQSIRECRFRTDTFVVGRADLQVHLGNDTVICDKGPLTLQVPIPGATFLWQDNSTDSVLQAMHSGTYWVRVGKEGCLASDTVRIRFSPVQQYLGNDTFICINDPAPLILKASVPPGGSVLWSNGSTEGTMIVDQPGTWWVRVTDQPCLGSDTIVVGSRNCNCKLEIPSAFTPNGDGRNDVYRPVFPLGCPVDQYELHVYNRWGQRVFSGTDPAGGWNGTYQGAPVESGTYMYLIRMNGTDRKGDITLIR